MVAQEASDILSQYGIDVKKLPRNVATELKGKIDLVTNQLTNHLRMQKKNAIELNVIHHDIEATLESITKIALTVISQKALPQALNEFIAKLAKEKPVAIEKLPEKLKVELDERKELVLTTLINTMKSGARDYVYVSELETLCHKKFDLFLERAKYILVSLWGQNAIASLNSLKFVTNTQPFPINQ